MSNRIQISGLVSRELRERVEKLATERKTSITAVVAEALERYLNPEPPVATHPPIVLAQPVVPPSPNQSLSISGHGAAVKLAKALKELGDMDISKSITNQAQCSICGETVLRWVNNDKGDPVCWPCVKGSRVTPMSPADPPRPWEKVKP